MTLLVLGALSLGSASTATRVKAQTTSATTPAAESTAKAAANRSPAKASTVAEPAQAIEAKAAPVLDGSDVDEVWKTATPITAFRVFDPVEDGEPRMRTEARAAYDGGNLYVFVRAFDPHPDSVIGLLSRRDVKTQSDQIKIMVDSYFDHRTGYEFAVNPVGVKRDYYLYDDVREDASWDAVWEVATKIDSLGWTAEFRVPLSQLRFPKSENNTFGLMIMRDVARTNERISWPVFRYSRRGVASQFGQLANLKGLGSPRRLELVPYALSRNVSQLKSTGFGRTQEQTAGLDLKYGLASNLTLNATINPDFGQVEADPAVLNLTAFESFFEERRPFFVESTGTFQFADGSLQLFYPRRIGRAPQLSGLVSDPTVSVPGSTTILGAAKVTGRIAGGTSLGAIAALTQRERADDITVEPQTGYGVARLSRDFRKGESGIGAMVTTVNRNLDEANERFLRRSAVVAGIDGRHRFADGKINLTGSIATSNVAGTRQAITRTQRSSVHFYQRPDAGLPYDTTRTSLAGTAMSAGIEKLGGVVRGALNYQRLTPGFEANDIGFLSQADMQTVSANVSLNSIQPKHFWRRATAFANLYSQFTADGLPTGRVPEIYASATLKNSSYVSFDLWQDNAGTVLCDRCARGGPALRISPSTSLLFNWQSDPRGKVLPTFAAIYTTADEGRSLLWRVRPYVTIRSASNASFEIGTRYQYNRDNTQWYANFGTVGTPNAHYLFANLKQHLLSFTSRASYTATPTLSLQVYAEPFVTTGKFSNVRELNDPRAKDYDLRFKPYALSSEPGGFNEKQFHSTTVVRWEYRPGSALFFVWSQGRIQDDRNIGNFAPRRDYRDLFQSRPDNTFLIKASYWLSL
jgi:hypothetical protein